MKNILTICLAVIMLACSNNSVPVATADNNAAFTLQLHELKNINGGIDYIRFDSVLTDSRCPKGVYCVWQGIATVKLLIGNKTEQQTFNLSTTKFKKNSTDTVLLGYKIELIDLQPHPDNKTTTIQPPAASLKITRQ